MESGRAGGRVRFILKRKFDILHLLNKIFVNKDGVIEEIFVGRQTFKRVSRMAAKAMVIVDTLLAEHMQIKFLVNLRGITTFTADSIIAAYNGLNNTYPAKRALYGGSKLVNGLIKIIVSATGKENKTKLFETRLEAENWLKKD